MINNYSQRKLQSILGKGYTLGKRDETDSGKFYFDKGHGNQLYSKMINYKGKRHEAWQDIRINTLIDKAYRTLN